MDLSKTIGLACVLATADLCMEYPNLSVDEMREEIDGIMVWKEKYQDVFDSYYDDRFEELTNFKNEKTM